MRRLGVRPPAGPPGSASRIASADCRHHQPGDDSIGTRRRYALGLRHFNHGIARNRSGGAQDPKHEAADRGRQAIQALRQAVEGEQRGDDVLEYPLIVLHRQIPVYHGLQFVPAAV